MHVGAECGRGGGEGDMIHPSRRETNQFCSDRGVAFTSCDTIMADYNNIGDIRKQKKAEYNRRYQNAKEGGI